MHLESTFKERSQRLVTFETFDLGDEERWPDQKRDNDKDRYKDKDKDNDKNIKRTPSKSDPRDLWPLRHLIREMRRHDLTKKDKDKYNNNDNDNEKDKKLF